MKKNIPVTDDYFIVLDGSPMPVEGDWNKTFETARAHAQREADQNHMRVWIFGIVEIIEPTNPLLQAILCAPLPAFQANIRHQARKEWAAAVRRLFRDMGLSGISVTAPHYSMASSIDIRLPKFQQEGAHQARHAEIDRTERANSAPWQGYNKSCQWCAEEKQAIEKIRSIVLAAFPDLDDRSDTQSDYFDCCLTIYSAQK